MTAVNEQVEWRSEAGIPVRNIWWLLFYASDLAKWTGETWGGAESSLDELPDLLAELLCGSVETRLAQNLSQGYVARAEILRRVRGRIDVLRCERMGLFAQAKVACRFLELTMNTPRNCYVRGALKHLSGLVKNKRLSIRCQRLALQMERLGVVGRVPGRRQMAAERFGRHDLNDRAMVAAADLAYRLKMPTEKGSSHRMPLVTRDEPWLRQLFEKAILGFYRVVLPQGEWSVKGGAQHHWPVSEKSPGAEAILPRMQTDIQLDHKPTDRRIIIDTKFAHIFMQNQFAQQKLKSEYIYQMYAYLQTQEGLKNIQHCDGVILHPSVDEAVDEYAVIQGHRLRFMTINLAATSKQIREGLLTVIE